MVLIHPTPTSEKYPPSDLPISLFHSPYKFSVSILSFYTQTNTFTYINFVCVNSTLTHSLFISQPLRMALSCTPLLMLIAMFVISAVAQSPASSPKAAASAPKAEAPNALSPSSLKSPPVVAPSPPSVVSSPPSPTPSSATSPSPSVPPPSISAPPSEAPAPSPSENGAISNGYAFAGSVAAFLAAAILIV
ncbi:hypothetical protein VNO77_22218 [Canavalia gladiata]|uniref:Uncharacterized protein n=1 Tax=Canavalia gladiata TaxID=3824 RepID=A0AAN9L2D3_CANGL